jgi:hypothetical protein
LCAYYSFIIINQIQTIDVDNGHRVWSAKSEASMLTNDQVEAVRETNRAVMSQNFEAIAGLLDADYKLHLILQPEGLLQKQEMICLTAMRDYLSVLYAAFPDFTVEESRINGTSSTVYHEFKIKATHLGVLALPNGPQLPPSGKPVEIAIEVYNVFGAGGLLKSSTANICLLDVLSKAGIQTG